MAKKQVAVSLRKPPSPEGTRERGVPTDVEKLDAFVSAGAADAAAPKQSDIREIRPEPEPRAAAPERAAAPPVAEPVLGIDGRPMRAITVYLPYTLAERLTLHCIELDRDVSKFVGEAVEQHLQKRLGAGAWQPAEPPGDAPGTGAGPSVAAQDDPFRWPYGFRVGPRVERFLQVGRVLVTLWRQRPWAA